MITVVGGFTKNVTHPQKTLVMIRPIFVDFVKTRRMTLLTIFGIRFLFSDDCFADDITVPSETQSNSDLDTSSSTDNWKVFNKRGLLFIYLNMNSILSNIDELRIIAKKSRSSVIGITESKLDKTVLDKEINIDGYELARSDRNRHGGGVACYIRNNISFNVRGDFSSEIENIFLDIFLPKAKPILIGILYRPPDQSRLLDKLSTAISSCFDNQELYILGDLNINLIINKNILQIESSNTKNFAHYTVLNNLLLHQRASQRTHRPCSITS